MKRQSGSLDKYDILLLEALQANARATLASLSGVVGLNASAIFSRMKRLETMGVLLGYSARIDPLFIGLDVPALISVFTSHDCDQEAAERAIAALPEVAELYTVSGNATFVAHVLTSSADHLANLLKLLCRLPGIDRVETTMILHAASAPRFGFDFAEASITGKSRRPGLTLR